MAEANKVIAKNPKWHLLYYALAAFDVMTIIGSIWLSTSILSIYNSSLEENTDWVHRQLNYEKLAEQASLVNAPGNDIFDSKDVPLEKSRLDSSLVDFNKLIDEDLKELEGISQPFYRERLRIQILTIQTSMNEMVAEANQIFNFISDKKDSLAGSRMATMDRKFAVLNNQLRALKYMVIEIQEQLLKSDKQEASTLGKYEYLFALAVLFIVLLVSLYGHMIDRNFRLAAQTIENQQIHLDQNRKLAELGTMAGGIAHEINNPLTVIKGFGGQLERLSEKGILDQQAVLKISKMIVKTTDRISAIINGLRLFSRDGSHDPFKRENVSALLTDTKLFCYERLKKKNVEFRCQEIKDDFQLDCRIVELSQIIINLLNNAADAVGGTEGAYAELKIELLKAEKIVKITVSDSGKLITDEVANKLFTPFFTTKAVGEGTGLGLSICMGVAKTHHGSLKLDRSRGQNQFVLEIPQFRDSNENSSKGNS